jgi:hypothetical protein
MLTTFILAAVRKIGRGLMLTVQAYTEASRLSLAASKAYPFSGI